MFSEVSKGDYIFWWEYILAPSYLLLIYAFSFIIREKFYKKSPLKGYFFPALSLKLIGGLSVCLIYNYYYSGGDTTWYFLGGKRISSVIFENFTDGIRLLFTTGGNFSPDLQKYVNDVLFVSTEDTYMVIKISSILQIFCFQSFLITSILFGFLSFFAIWHLFSLFTSYYPSLRKEFALPFLYTPSVFFWGSGILKDTICLAFLSIFFCCVDGFFFKRRNLLLNGIAIILSAYILLMVKVYIIMSFSLCLIILILLNYRSKIKSRNLRLFITPIFTFFALALGSVLLQFISENTVSDKYKMDKLMETASVTSSYIYSVGGGSSYSLGEIEYTPWGMIKAFPAGVNVTLFRPYLWESHNAIALIAALESLFILFLTLKVFLKDAGPIKFLRIILSKNIVFFCFSFSLIFAFAVGISSYNFGTLVRYKIPCIPFYVASIQIIRYWALEEKKRKRIKKLNLEMA